MFSGYSEDAVAQALGTEVGAVQHPPLVSEFRLPGGWPLPVGVIFTTRGCSFTCTFCQTTAFAPRPKAIPLEAIERAVQFYVARGIRYALILDENFGNIPAHAEAVIDLLARYGIRWLVQSRVDLFLRHFDEWLAKGMEGALFGIESFHQDVLKQIHKGEKVEAVLELARRLNRARRYAHGYYIIGFPSETPESIREDLRTLASLELDVTQITIVTPHPRTQMWNELETQYGIFERDWSKYDTKHLVWNHPQLPAGKPRRAAEGRLRVVLRRAVAAAHHAQVPEQPIPAARFGEFAGEPAARALGGAAGGCRISRRQTSSNRRNKRAA